MLGERDLRIMLDEIVELCLCWCCIYSKWDKDEEIKMKKQRDAAGVE